MIHWRVSPEMEAAIARRLARCEAAYPALLRGEEMPKGAQREVLWVYRALTALRMERDRWREEYQMLCEWTTAAETERDALRIELTALKGGQS